MQSYLKPPNMMATLKTASMVVPQTHARLLLLAECMLNFGATEQETNTARQGYSEGAIVGISIEGTDSNGRLVDQASLRFDKLLEDVKLTLNVVDGKSFTETFSLPLAKALEYAVQSMRRKNLRVTFYFWFAEHITANPEAFDHALRRFGLVRASGAKTADGWSLNSILTVRPNADKGIEFGFSSALPTKR